MTADVPANPEPDPAAAEIAARVRAGNRAALGRAVTLLESSRPEHRALGAAVLAALPPPEIPAIRIGVTGPPGVGKSTFLDAFGAARLAEGRKVGVLAVDPSSSRTRGAILGDKTRMARLAAHPRAYVRPTASGGVLGGAARRTREAIRLLEGAGFDLVMVETVGVGQSETAVADLVDTVIALLPPGGGDALQGIKRGLMERADVLVVTKADGDLAIPAARAARELEAAVHILEAREGGWTPPVVTASGLAESGLDDVWTAVRAHRAHAEGSGAFQARRRAQARAAFERLVREGLEARALADPAARTRWRDLARAVETGPLDPGAAAEAFLVDGSG